jgi:cobalt-precorrin-5B (C1)-methyltransferase
MSDPKFYCCAEDLAIGYGKTPLMEHIGLGVGKGSILTLIGPNGAGKSTLLKTLAAQLAPQGGAVLLDGKNLADCSGPERARKMALMVPPPHRADHLLRDGVRRALPLHGAAGCPLGRR